MNIKKGFVIQEVGGQWVAVARGRLLRSSAAS